LLATEGCVAGVFTDVSADLAEVSDVAYLAVENAGLLIVDMRQPCHPRNLGIYRISGEISDIVVLDRMAYLAVKGGTVRMIDVSDPLAPLEIS